MRIERVIIHRNQDKEKAIFVYQEYGNPEPDGPWDQFPTLTSWEGRLSIDKVATKQNVRKIMAKNPFEINEYFPEYTGTAYIKTVGNAKPIIVEFEGSGPIKWKGTEIRANHPSRSRGKEMVR